MTQNRDVPYHKKTMKQKKMFFAQLLLLRDIAVLKVNKFTNNGINIARLNPLSEDFLYYYGEEITALQERIKKLTTY